MVEEGLMIFNCLSEYPWAVWVHSLMVYDLAGSCMVSGVRIPYGILN